MRTSAKVLVLFGALLGLMLLADTAAADCCSSNGGICGDCSQGTPCCATGSCNIFCCNCDGTCRSGPCDACPPAATAETSRITRARFDAIDKDDDQSISWQETKKWAGRALQMKESELRRRFTAVDKNRNGSIEPSEFDSSLAKQ